MDTSKIVAVATCAQGEEAPRRVAVRTRGAHGADAPSRVARVRRPIVATATMATAAPITTAQAARIDADETARRRLARELHDSVGAELAATHFALANVNASLPADAPPQYAEALALVARSLNAAAEAVRHVLDGLSAPQLDAGLVAALDEWTRGFGARTGLAITFVCEADERVARLCPDATLAVFRVAQEALANVARHACAARVDMRLECTAGHLTLTIADDGIGLPRGASRTGARRNRYGVAGMRERCAAFGGTLRAGTRGTHAGTVVRARFAWDALFAASASPLSTLAVRGAHS
ncbi:histidine kinase [Paraburkholderia sp.]|uniref:sensor histidine kinase n=1 Tax=Paraburkholderia sp. TaxID=1926495 RepID=UPI0025DC31AA|nr:histidine kinase [Paraburkholderia sp.]